MQQPHRSSRSVSLLRAPSVLSTVKNLHSPFSESVRVESLWKAVCHDKGILENLTNCIQLHQRKKKKKKTLQKQQSVTKFVHSLVLSGKSSFLKLRCAIIFPQKINYRNIPCFVLKFVLLELKKKKKNPNQSHYIFT